MAKYISGSGAFEHPQAGAVRFVVRKQARKFIARWKGGVLHLTLPPLTTISDLERALESMMPRIMATRPSCALYELGQEMKFELFSVKIAGVKSYDDRCTLHRVGQNRFEIRVDESVNMDEPESVEAVARMMKSLARYLAPSVLLPRAQYIAEEIGVKPNKWKLASGRKTLGRCDSRGVISLSVVLVFMPEELRDYVICHELAHLTEMNHSADFHKVCDRYCGGRESELERRLKAFRIPLP